MRFNIVMKARHIAGKLNFLADHLSRLQVLEFKQIAPWADAFPSEVPMNILPTAVEIK